MDVKGKINWGVIGSGGIASRRTIPEGIVPAELAHLVAVYDINEQVNNSVAGENNAYPAKSLDDLLESDIEAVYVASPVESHFEQVTTCARAGKHVLCEKPLGLSVREAEEMAGICKENGVLLGTGLMMRFHTRHELAKRFIRQGRIGIPVYARAQLSCWYPPIEGAWRQDPLTGGGGSLMDMGSHCIDLLEMLFGNVKSVNCFVNNNVHAYKSEDSAVVSMMFENGAMGTVDTYFCIPDNSSKNVLELYGSKGSIIAKGTIGQGDAGEMVAFLEGDEVGYDTSQERSIGDGLIMKPEPRNTYLAEIEDFSLAIIDKREPSVNSDIGIRSQRIMQACYDSASRGKVINV
jgi:predicted dehydrogenase